MMDVERYVMDIPDGFAFIDVAGDDVSGRAIYYDGSAKELHLTRDKLLIKAIAQKGKHCVGSSTGEPSLGKVKIARELLERR